MQRTTHLSECVVCAGSRSKLHLDLALQVQADIQMLYYYITSPLKKQGVQRNFSNFRKNHGAAAFVFAIAPGISAAAPQKTEPLSHFALRCLCLLRRTDGTCICASAAVKTCIGVDDVLAVTLGNCTCRTCVCASAALDACIADCICHSCYLLL